VVLPVAVAAIVMVAGGQLAMRDGPTAPALAVWLGGLAVVVRLQWPSMRDATEPGGSPDWQPLSRVQMALICAAALETLGVVLLAWRRHPAADQTPVVVAWAAALVALLAAGWSADGRSRGRAQWRSRWFAGWAAWERWAFGAVVALAAGLRLYRLGRYPWTIDGDGAAFALLARDVRDGVLRNPFTTGYYDQGTLFAFVQAGGTWLFGDTVAGVTAVSGLAGTAAVGFTYVLSRRLFGPRVAVVAGLMLAVFHFHLYISRVALNNAFDVLAIVAMLYFADRAFVEGRRFDAAVAGVVLGLGQYFYFSTRILPAIAVLHGVFLVVGERRRIAVRRGAALAGWLAAGASIAFLPLGLHYLDEPEDFNARGRQVSVLGEWLDVQTERTGRRDAEVLARQARDAALLPFATRTDGHYRPGAPLLGWPVAIPAAIGLAIATASLTRRRSFPLAVAWWGSLAGVGLTVGLSTQRWSIALPLVAMFAASGIDATARVLLSAVAAWSRVWSLRRHRRAGTVATSPTAAAAVVAIPVVAIAVWNVAFYFRDSNDLTLYGDGNTLVATSIARELEDEPAGTVVHLVAAPRMSFRSHNSIELVAPQVLGDDVVVPIVEPSHVPAVGGRTVFIFLPERAAELQVVRAVHPGGTVRRATWRDGELLYVTYRLDGG
jgi:4-amino-4-deoxy-L-arabinose transferase-like glycosyltransferase